VDCYDGSDGQPRIYHHNTLTSKILFEEVLKAIRDYGNLFRFYSNIYFSFIDKIHI
jgi:hypothetical protein